MPCDNDLIGAVFTKRKYLRQCGKLIRNRSKRAAVEFPREFNTKHDCEYSYLVRIGEHAITKNMSMEEVNNILKLAGDLDHISVLHPTRFCSHCGRPSSYFIDRERAGHSTCTGCGVVQKLFQSKFSLRLNDDGQANKSQWEHTPGMTHYDCSITTRKGRRIGKKPKSHQRNKWRIRGKIEEIANEWHFNAMESIIRVAKMKLDIFYRRVHPDDEDDDNGNKLPHGGAALAAACFYCAVLEFEERVRFKTPCTLPAIQESAQQCRDHKNGRKCRDVTNSKILRYSKMLKRHGLCAAKVPTIGAESLLFHPKSASLQHARMAIFSDCFRLKFHLPINEKWGIRVKDTNQGVLFLDKCSVDAIAWKRGLRKGDYLFQVDGDTIDIDFTSKKLAEKIVCMKKQPSKSVVAITIMRKKKNKV